MSWKSIACVAALGAIAAPALAAPSINVVKVSNTTGRIDIITTAAGSIGAEINLILAGATLTGATINSAIFDTANPGDNPFIAGSPVGGDTTGLGLDLANNRLFASYGSGSQPAGTYKLLDFTYTGVGTGTGDGFVASIGALQNVAADVEALGGVIGDTDGNGNVNLQDLFNVQNNFGGTSPPSLGDTDGNGTIDLQDLFNVQNNFGAGAATAVAVPEPASALVALLAVAGVVLGRRV
jgi:hypothetical protein